MIPQKTIAAVLSVTMFSITAQANPLTPITATGWNEDIVLGAGEAFDTGTTATMDMGNKDAITTWYGIGYNTGAPTTGLPTGLTTSLRTKDLSFQLQPFTAKNALLNGGTLTLSGAPAAYVRLALIGSTGDGAADVTVTVNFADASTSEVFSNLGGSIASVNGDHEPATINSDWFFEGPDTFVANGRVKVDGSFDKVNSDDASLYESILTLANHTSPVSSVTITNSSGEGNNAIMAISGEAVP